MIHLCSACGTSYASLAAPPQRCEICNDERQFVPVKGQRWTTEQDLHRDHANTWRQIAPNVLSIQTEPRFAIGQRAFLITTPNGNILWDCLACLDAATVTLVRKLGGINAIAISHPHYYTTMQDWASAFDATIFLHADDRQWVMRDSPHIRFWSGESLSIVQDVSVVRLGGHFAGGTVLHCSQDRGVIFAGDIVQVSPGADRVSFMWSYPNLLPLPAAKVVDIAARLDAYDFDRVYGAFAGQDIGHDAKKVVAQSAAHYVACLRDERP
ncbi:MBL fold metallo-hydrolase [Sphingomonas sp. PAMC 26621]|uniref:MBL fold metallo-hydrolase n=1 Tax=Sphingomonas sp. PAMC 26621 TaxID=1112213 RepID=UPI00028889B3|nr:MBL fold metallo-hydrolase [Sphingomonas sp. PAMC 26621]